MSLASTFGGARLFNADWQSVESEIGTFDHLITDPPYENHMHVAKAGSRGIRTDGHASPQALDFDSIEGQRDDITRLGSLASGWFMAFCTPEGVAPWRDSIEAAGMRYKRCLFWCKPDSAPQMNGQGPAMAVECYVAAWAGRGHSVWNGGGGRNWTVCPCQPRSRDGRHPTEKPLALMSDIITKFTQPGDTILDPCMGSGTTGVAALRLGRKFIGAERDADYYSIAVERIEAASMEPVDLFAAPGRRVKPQTLQMDVEVAQ